MPSYSVVDPEYEKAIGPGVSWSNLTASGTYTAALTPGLYQLFIRQVHRNNPTGIILTDQNGNVSNTFLGHGPFWYAVGMVGGSYAAPNTITVAVQAGGGGVANLALIQTAPQIGPDGAQEVFC